MVKNITLSGGLSGSGVADDTGNANVIGNLTYGAANQQKTINNLWYPVCGWSTAPTFNDNNLALLVSNGFQNTNSAFGILFVAIRINNNSAIVDVKWEYCGAGFNPDDFVLAHKKDSDGKLHFVLYTRLNGQYQGRMFTRLSEHNTGGISQYNWTFIRSTDASADVVASIPAEYTQIQSTLGTLQNPVTGMVKNVLLTGAITGSGTISNGTISISTKNSIPIFLNYSGSAEKSGIRITFATSIVFSAWLLISNNSDGAIGLVGIKYWYGNLHVANNMNDIYTLENGKIVKGVTGNSSYIDIITGPYSTIISIITAPDINVVSK